MVPRLALRFYQKLSNDCQSLTAQLEGQRAIAVGQSVSEPLRCSSKDESQTLDQAYPTGQVQKKMEFKFQNFIVHLNLVCQSNY